MSDQPEHELGGVAGGLLGAFESIGRALLTLLIGARYTSRRTLGGRAFTGAASLGLALGVIVGTIARGPVGAMIGALAGFVVGAMAAAFLLLLIGDLSGATGAAIDPPGWRDELKRGGVSAHEIDEIETTFSHARRAAYFKKYRLSREDGESVENAHYTAYNQVKGIGRWRDMRVD